MLTDELIAFLIRHPGRLVYALTSSEVTPIVDAEIDVFNEDEGVVALLICEGSE